MSGSTCVAVRNHGSLIVAPFLTNHVALHPRWTVGSARGRAKNWRKAGIAEGIPAAAGRRNGCRPAQSRHDGTIAATMSTGAQIRWRIMPLTAEGQIGNIRLRGLLRAHGWRPFADSSLPRGVYVSWDAEISGAVESRKFVNPYRSLSVSLKNQDKNGHESGVHPGLGHKARARELGFNLSRMLFITRARLRSRTSLRAGKPKD